ncbi:MAG: hypothetical protein GTN73_03370 [Candidatus Aminicenantes bacterium]|nr:hypothetical protein [Candidatus Aminicenantes bacterium]
MSKSHEKSIVNPEPLRDFVAEEVICIPFDPPSRFLQKAIKKRASKEKNIGFGYLYHLKNKIVLYQSLGAPSVVLSLERLIVSGAKKIILLGFCGSLNPKFKIMNVVSISKAFSEEGTSKHYFPRKRIFYPSLPLKNRIEAALYDSKLPFLKGSLVSTDAPYRETRSWLKQKQKTRINLVDMEASAVFAIAKFYAIQAAALTIISDELWSSAWNQKFLRTELEEKMKKYFIPFIKELD